MRHLVRTGGGHGKKLAALVHGHGDTQSLGKRHSLATQHLALEVVAETMGSLYRFLI